MCDTVYGTFRNDHVSIRQYKYPHRLHKAEVRTHEMTIHEYAPEILATMAAVLEAAAANMKLYANQPYVSAAVRYKLVDFLLKMLVRLKLVPFVFYRAVRMFDRYCLKRIVLLDQAQLIITTCLWIAAKVVGGNNHFANLASQNNNVHTIADLGYGSGARFKGPTERYRLPKLAELIKLCGLRCNYDAAMFRQMELHIMDALDWRVNDPGIDEFMVYSHEFKITTDDPMEAKLREFFYMKEFAANASCYSYELVGYSPLQVLKVVVDLINDTFLLHESDVRHQTLNQAMLDDEAVVDFRAYRDIRRHLVLAIARAPLYLLQLFDLRGPHLFHLLVAATYRPAANYPVSLALEPLSTSSSVFSEYPSNYSYASPAPSVHDPEYREKPLESRAPFLPHSSNQTLSQGSGLAIPTYDPPLCPHACLSYPRNNGSTSSFRSASSKDHDVFDYTPARYGLCTPMSVDDEVKPVPEMKRRAL